MVIIFTRSSYAGNVDFFDAHMTPSQQFLAAGIVSGLVIAGGIAKFNDDDQPQKSFVEPQDIKELIFENDDNLLTKNDLIFSNYKKLPASANKIRIARIKNTGQLVFYKKTKPRVAELETVVSEFYRQVLSRNCVSSGRMVREGQDAIGIYTKAIPGFVSLGELSNLSKDPDAYRKIDEIIQKLNDEIATLQAGITVHSSDDNYKFQASALQEKQDLLGSWVLIRDQALINIQDQRVDVEKIPDLIAKGLCTAFFLQDWDRHKENFGVSYNRKDKKLNIASLDYDKSLSGLFYQQYKLYDWAITSKLLTDFPVFDCWYWPTSSGIKDFFISKFFPQKAAKCYNLAENRQYSALKNNKEFQRQALIEWLKIIFIPKEVRQKIVNDLVVFAYDQKLADVPEYLEKRRLSLLQAVTRCDGFKEVLANGVGRSLLLEQVRKELKVSLTAEEFDIVTNNWESTLKEIEYYLEN